MKHNNYWHNENFNHGFYKLLLFTHTKYFIFLLLSPETNKKIMAGILSYEPAFDRKIAENSSQSLKRDRRPSFPVSKWTKILGTSVCINQNFRKFRSKTQWIYKTRCNLHLATLVPEVVLDFSPREKETSTYQRASRFVLAALLVSNILLTSQSLCIKLYPPDMFSAPPQLWNERSLSRAFLFLSAPSTEV